MRFIGSVHRGEDVSSNVAHEVGLHASIEHDLEGLMTGKSHGALKVSTPLLVSQVPLRQMGWDKSILALSRQELDAGIQQQLESGDCADPEYWDAVRRRLKVHLARSRLREIHGSLQEKHREQMEGNVAEKMGWNTEQLQPPGNGDVDAWSDEEEAKEQTPQAPMPPQQQQSLADAAAKALQRLTYDSGAMSPPPLSEAECTKDDIVDDESDTQLLLQLRAQVSGTGQMYPYFTGTPLML